MTLTINLSPEKEAAYQLLAQAHGLSIEQWLTQLVEQSAPVAPSEAPPAKPAGRHTSEVILERMSKVPREIMATMPVDGASQHDHYIYGLPKRD